MTEETAFFDGDIGPERYRLRVPPLALADYGRVQGLMLRPLLRRANRWRGFAGFLITLVLGAMVGVLIANADPSGILVIGSLRFGWTLTLPGTDLALAAFAAFVIVLVLRLVLAHLRHRRLLRRFHTALYAVNSPHEVVIGENGLITATPLGRTIAPWAAITAYIPDKDMHYLVIDRLSAVWIPESAIAGRPDRDALVAFLREKVPAGG